MTSSTASDRYATPVIALHWLIFLLIVISFASIELREFFPKGSAPREAMKSLHFMIGLTVLALVVARIAARFLSPTPRILPPPPHWQEIAARVVHLALLVFMVAMPILGWLILSAEGDPVPFWGLELPPLIAADKALAEQIEEIHETVGNIGYFLIGAHAAAALFHHYVVRDNTLVRMLPRRSA
jgi:cytochrome b561